VGEAGNDEIFGNEGGDVKLGNIVGPGDRDRIFGQGGDDVLDYSDADGLDRLDCGEGDDTATFDPGDRVATNCRTTTEVTTPPMW